WTCNSGLTTAVSPGLDLKFVQPNCTSCTNGTYSFSTSQSGAIVPGTTDTGNHCDDCLASVALPFAYTLYDQSFTSAQVSSNGQLDFLTGDSGYNNVCLPDGFASYAIFPYLDDL